MQTIYIDVYFLINLVVDILVIYFSSYISKIRISIAGILITSSIGALFASLNVVFVTNKYLTILISVLYTLIMVMIITRKASFFRKVRFVLLFYTFFIVFGGAVSYGFLLIKRFVGDIDISEIGEPNRKLLYLSIIVLFVVLLIKMFLLSFDSSTMEKTCTIKVFYKDTEHEIISLIDTGNFAVDPFDGTSVVFLTKNEFERVFGERSSDELDSGVKFKAKLRVIPIHRGDNFEIVYALRADKTYVKLKKKLEEVNLLFALDKNNKSYNGYFALAPGTVANFIK